MAIIDVSPGAYFSGAGCVRVVFCTSRLCWIVVMDAVAVLSMPVIVALPKNGNSGPHHDGGNGGRYNFYCILLWMQ